MKAVIIDDEPKGPGILQKMIERHCPDIQVVAITSSADEAYDLILEHKPRILFLDMEMQGDSGFSLLERFNEIDFHIIVTTAIDLHELPEIRHRVSGYLLKPIDIDELLACAQKLKNQDVAGDADDPAIAARSSSRLAFTDNLSIPVKEGVFHCAVADVIRVESDGSYSTFYVSGGKRYVVSKSLKEYEELLPDKEFFRVHKSHLINIHKIQKYIHTDGDLLEMADGALIGIARRKKEGFLQVMNIMRKNSAIHLKQKQ